MNKKKGFVTVATGDEKYYKLAANLYLSYKGRGEGKYPFALICDRVNEFSNMFDNVIIVNDIRKSTVDKLLMINSPYEESIFIDADTLVLRNIDDLWDVFQEQDDVSAFGCMLPLDSQKGWFTYEGSGKYKEQIKYLISMNGGIYYFRKTEKAKQVFAQAVDIINDYFSIDFKYFSQPQDEPLMAMSMVINECKPCDVAYDMITLPQKVTVDIQGNIYDRKKPSNAKMIHFSTRKTSLFLYNYLNEVNHYDDSWKTHRNYLQVKLKYMTRDIKFNVLHNGGAVLRKFGFNQLVERLKKMIG